MTCIPQCYQCGADLHLLASIDDAQGEPSDCDPCQEWQIVCALCRHRDELHSHQQKLPIREMIRAYEEETGTCIGCD
jgi:DNA replication protein DnaC